MQTRWECASRVRKSVQRVLRRVAVGFVLPGGGMVARSWGQGPPSQPAESKLKE
jgi:hypothetical protein